LIDFVIAVLLGEMENGKRSIGKNRAEKPAKALNAADYRIFL